MLSSIGLKGSYHAAVVILLACLSVWGAPKLNQRTDAGPVPPSIGAAKKVFISNAGGYCNLFGDEGFSGGPDRAYNEFYTAIEKWGHYDLSASPSGTELEFSVSFVCPAAAASVLNGRTVDPVDAYDPQLRLVILDIPTHVTLWTITEHVKLARLRSNRDKNFDRAMAEFVRALQDLTARAAATATH